MKLTFWGVRGSIPTPGRNTNVYGGNTTCLEVRSQTNDVYLIDAGSGIREAGNALMKEFRGNVKAKIFISHIHWDHIQGFPFFTPAYVPSCEVTVHSGDKDIARRLGEQSGTSDTAFLRRQTLEASVAGNTTVMSKSPAVNHTKDVLNHQQDVAKGYFPISIDQMGSKLTFKDLKEYEIIENGVCVNYMFHDAHPGGMFSYKMQEGNKILVFTGDYEHDGSGNFEFGPTDKKMIEWAKDADAFIIDTQYTPKEYETKRKWGHSQIERACELAAAANVKRVYMTHHDPLHTDEFLKTMEVQAQTYMRDVVKSDIPVCLAKEGMSVEV